MLRRGSARALRRAAAALLPGALLGGGLVALFACSDPPFREVEVFRERATPQELAEWRAEWDRRAGPWQDVPDPPGDGPVHVARYWVSRTAYEMEVRRRGDRMTLAIHGVDIQTFGGGWTAFGEGRVTGASDSFAGAVATCSWACLGIRFRHASDGVARLTFSADGEELAAVYVAHEASGNFYKAYGRLQRGEKPPYGSVRGQIPFTPGLLRLAPAEEHRVQVQVRDEGGGYVPDALVQLKGLDRTRVHADPSGRAEIRFTGRDAPWALVVCAGKPGYRNGEAVLFAEDLAAHQAAGGPLEVRLAAIDPVDHPAYQWKNPAPDTDPDDAMSCGSCHLWHYDEWRKSRHARSADHGHVQHVRAAMVAADPAAPDDCRGCHQPADALDRPGGDWSPRGPLAGVHCDLCHKVRAVGDLSASGVFGSLLVSRPDPASRERPGGIHHVFGASPDVTFAYMGASYDPLFQASHLCAGCHQGGGRRDLGTPKIDTFEEWRSFAAARQDERFRSCQDCHMPGGTTLSDQGKAVDQFAWDAIHRRPGAVHSHRFEGTSAAFAGPALDLRVDKRHDAATGEWVVSLELRNVGAGHKIPTGTWEKHVAVGVWATHAGKPLVQSGGGRAQLVPGDAPDEGLLPGDWRNPAGTVLGVRPKDPAYGLVPAPFWGAFGPDGIVDERLSPDEVRLVECRFRGTGPGEEPVVEVQVVHRRGAIGTGPGTTPWQLRAEDPPPQTLWKRVVR
jgi:hypothetical protein